MLEIQNAIKIQNAEILKILNTGIPEDLIRKVKAEMARCEGFTKGKINAARGNLASVKIKELKELK